MKLRELQTMVEEDSELDISSLDQHSLETAKLQSKYYILYSRFLAEQKANKYDLDNLLVLKGKYYKGQADPAVYKEKPFNLKLTNAQVDAHVRADPDVLKLQKAMDMLDIKLELIKDMKRSLEQRNWTIRNAIEFIKFKAGG